MSELEPIEQPDDELESEVDQEIESNETGEVKLSKEEVVDGSLRALEEFCEEFKDSHGRQVVIEPRHLAEFRRVFEVPGDYFQWNIMCPAFKRITAESPSRIDYLSGYKGQITWVTGHGDIRDKVLTTRLNNMIHLYTENQWLENPELGELSPEQIAEKEKKFSS